MKFLLEMILILALLSPFLEVNLRPGIDGGITSAYTTTGNPLIALGGFGGSTFPSGYLNYILFDENYVPIRAKSFPVQNLPSTRHTVQFDQPLEIKELGYLFVYLSYDNNQSNLYLYFDDLKVVVDESPVIQVNNYYPFGMVSNTWLREGEIDNAKLFQGKELIAQTGWHDFGSRMYWADLGRWFSTDPQKQFSSPYVGMGNMPTIAVDPDGQFAWFIPVIAGALVGGYSGAAIQQGTWDPTQWKSDWYKGAIVGAVVGGALGTTIAAVSKAATGITTTATIGGEAATVYTTGWSITSTAFYSGSVNAAFAEIGDGEAWRGALSGLTTGLSGTGLSALGGSLLGTGKTLGSGLLKLTYEAASTTATSVLGNMAAGADAFSSLNIGVGPFALALRDGEVSLAPMDNLNNLLFLGAQYKGLRSVINGTADVKFDKSSISWSYNRKSIGELARNGKLDGKTKMTGGPHNTLGQNYYRAYPGVSTILHENYHLLTRRIAQDSYLSFLFGTLEIGNIYRKRSLFRFDNLDRRLAWKISGYMDGN